MSARSSVGDQAAACQVVGCRQSATALAVEVLVPASGGIELELELCPEHRDEVERALETAMDAVFLTGLEAVQTAMRAGWGGNGVVTWAVVLERLGGLVDDVPTRLALAGLAGRLGASGALVWWASHHYVAGPATGWRWTTWEKAGEGERRAARRERDHKAAEGAPDSRTDKR